MSVAQAKNSLGRLAIALTVVSSKSRFDEVVLLVKVRSLSHQPLTGYKLPELLVTTCRVFQ